VLGAERLGHDGAVGAETALHQRVRPLAALRLADDARDHEVALQAKAGPADGLGGHDDAGHAAFMFWTPWLYSRSPSSEGVQGSRFHRRVSALMSVCPFSIRLAPPPVPGSVAIAWRRPGSTSCSSTR
jgi:hypothetical protein